jgi:hypothetical protein
MLSPSLISRTRPLVGIVTGTAALCVLLACGTGSTSSATKDPSKGQVAYQTCVQKEAGDRPATPDDAYLAKLRTASVDCQKKTGYQPPSVQDIPSDQKQAQLQRSLKFAACMRQHGVNMGDPQITSNGVEIKSSPGSSPPDPSSPAYKAANQACQGLLAQGTTQGAGTNQGTGTGG